MGEPRDPSDTRRDFQNTNSSSGTHASARQRKGTSLSTKTSAPSPPSPDERSKKLCAANKRNTRATDSNSVLKYGLETVTRNPHRDCLTKSPTVGSSEVRRAVYRVHACLEYIQQIETCAVAEIAKPGTHLYIYHFIRGKKERFCRICGQIFFANGGLRTVISHAGLLGHRP